MPNGTDWSHLVDLERRTVSPRAFVDADVYEDEQARIFGRCWLYVAHDSQLPDPGDFVTHTMGEEPVLVVRDADGRLRVFLNSCRHRGARLCRLDSGNAKTFSCPYHGWTYNDCGRLVGVPQFREAYYGELEREEWGLIEVPRVESFRGLVFACFDEHAVSLDDYLGDMKWYLDLIFDKTEAGMVVLPGTHRWKLGGNWKLAAEQFNGDNYHTGSAHRAMIQIGLGPSEGSGYQGNEPWVRDFEAKLDRGHGWINFKVEMDAGAPPALIAHLDAMQAAAKRRLTPAQSALVGCVQVGTVFPNFSVLTFLGFLTVRVWHPRGPHGMEVYSWGMIEKEAPPEVVEIARKAQILTFSPSGIFEQDDGEMWGNSVETMRGAQRRRYPLNYQMGAGHGRTDPAKPGLIHPPSTEIGVFGLYEQWRALMGGAD